MLTALLHAMTSLVALLPMLSSSSALIALQITVTLTVLVALLKPMLSKAGLWYFQ